MSALGSDRKRICGRHHPIPCDDVKSCWSLVGGNPIPQRLEGFIFLIVLTVIVWAGPAWADPHIVINEIHCNPDDETELVEFVELYNAGATDVDLSGWYFDAGLTYRFAPGDHIGGRRALGGG